MASANRASDEMSDELSKPCLRFKQEIVVSEPEISYAAKANIKKIIFALDIPFPLLKEWHKILSTKPREVASGANFCTGSEDEQGCSTQSTRKLDYVDLLEYSIPYGLFAFTDDQSIKDEISVHLSKVAGFVVQLYKKTKGRARKKLDEKVRKIYIHEGQVKSVRGLIKEMEFMRDETEEWKAKYKDLEGVKEKMYQEMEQNKRVIGELRESNKEIENYAKTLEETLGTAAHKEKVVA